MATLKEYYDVDFNRYLAAHKPWEMKNNKGEILHPMTARISYDFDGNAKYWSFFIQEGSDINGYVNLILSAPETANCVLSPEGDGVYVETGFSDYSEKMSSTTLCFTKRVFLYIDVLLDAAARKHITEFGAKKGFHIIVRDKEYALKRSELEKPLAFISHDSKDKDELVRELVLEMSKLMCPVWYDEYSLKVGDSLRASIEKGLKETKNCVIILSPNFLSNEGWGRAEFDSVFTREILEKNNVILPVWHNVTVNDVYQYSPRLADKVGLNSSLGVKELARRLSNVIKHGSI